jgi:uncharacterized protein (TIGR02118 family)
MYKATVLYGHPKDPAHFDSYYESVHIPIAREMRGLTGWTITKTDGDSPYYLIAELFAESREKLDAIFDSPEGRAASADLDNFATGGTTFLYGEVQTVIPVRP